jgi:hypothetical protein
MSHLRETDDPTLDVSQWTNRGASAQAIRGAQARNTSSRRRLIDSTTCDRDYSSAEIEFMQAMQAYKVIVGRMFPTSSDILEVIRRLGYQKA